jgi:hypothetical protein
MDLPLRHPPPPLSRSRSHAPYPTLLAPTIARSPAPSAPRCLTAYVWQLASVRARVPARLARRRRRSATVTTSLHLCSPSRPRPRPRPRTSHLAPRTSPNYSLPLVDSTRLDSTRLAPLRPAPNSSAVFLQ